MLFVLLLILIFQICVSSEAKYIHIKEQVCTQGDFDSELANQVLVFVGLNNKDTETVLKEDSPLRSKYEYKVQKIYKPIYTMSTLDAGIFQSKS